MYQALCIAEYALAFLIAGFALWRVIRTVRFRHWNDAPRWFKCNYVVLGLTSEICPECGSNLYSGGVIPMGPSRSSIERIVPSFAGLVAACVLVIWACFAIGGFCLIVLFQYQQVRESSTLDYQAQVPKGSAKFHGRLYAEITLDSDSWRLTPAAQSVQATLTGEDGAEIADWDVGTRIWSLRDGAHAAPRQLRSIAGSDLAAAFPKHPFDPRIVDSVAAALRAAAASPDIRSFDVTAFATLPRGPPIWLGGWSGGTGAASLKIHTRYLSVYLNWFLIALWALFLPRIAGRRAVAVYGREAAIGLSAANQLAPLEK